MPAQKSYPTRFFINNSLIGRSITMSRSFDDSNQVQDEVQDVKDEVKDVKAVENEENIVDGILDRMTSTEFIRLLNIKPDKRLETLTHHYRTSIKNLDSQSIDKLDKLNMRSENDPVSREIHTEKVENKNLKIIIIGPPVSGKTTFARKLAEHYGIKHLESKLIVQNHINAIRDELISLRDQDLHMGMIELIDKDDQTEELTKVKHVDSKKMFELEKELEKLYSSMDANNGVLEDDHFCLLLEKEISHLRSTKRGYVLDGRPITVDEARKIFNNTNSPQQIDIDKLPNITVCFKRKTQPNPSTVVSSSDKNAILNISSNEKLERRSLNRRIVFTGVNDVEKQNNYEVSNYKMPITSDVSVKPILKTNDSSDGPTGDKFTNLIWDEQEHDNILKMLNNHYVPMKMIESPNTSANINSKILNQDLEQMLNIVIKEIELIQQYGSTENTNLNESNPIGKIVGKRKIHELERLKEKMTLLDEFERVTDFECLEHISSEVYLKKYVTPTLTKLMVQVAKVRPQNPVDFLAYMALKENPEGLPDFPGYSVKGVKVKNIMERMFRMCGYSKDAIESNSLLRLFLVPSTNDDGEGTISEE